MTAEEMKTENDSTAGYSSALPEWLPSQYRAGMEAPVTMLSPRWAVEEYDETSVSRRRIQDPIARL
jgi:hypothetical protein